MQSALQELETTYLTLQSQINMLSGPARRRQQRDALSTQYVQARNNYWACVNKAFHDDDPQVVNLTEPVKRSQPGAFEGRPADGGYHQDD